MNTRFKMIAAALGLVIATGAVADASAKTAVKTATTKVQTTKTVRGAKPHAVEIAGRAHRLHLVRHGVTRWSVAHRLAPRVKVAHKIWIKPATRVTVAKSRLVGIQKVAHRTIVRKTIIR